MALPISLPSRFALALLPAVTFVFLRQPNTVLVASIAYIPFDPFISGSAVLQILKYVLLLGLLWVAIGKWSTVPLSFFVVAALIMLVLVSRTRSFATTSSSDFPYLLLGLLACLLAISTRPSVRLVIGAIALKALAVSIAILTGAFGATFIGSDPLEGLNIGRVFVLGLNPNALGGILGLGVVAIVFLAMQPGRIPYLLALVPLFAAMGETKSRGALVMMVAGLLFLILTSGLRRAAFILATVAFVLVLFPSFIGKTQSALLGGRLSQDLTYSTDLRLHAAQDALSLALHNPLFGVGYGNFNHYSAIDPLIGFPLATHNDFLRVASEVGIPALLLLAALIFMSLYFARRVGDGRGAAAIVIAFTVSLYSYNGLENLGYSLGFWVLLGALVGSSRADEGGSFGPSNATFPPKPRVHLAEERRVLH